MQINSTAPLITGGAVGLGEATAQPLAAGDEDESGVIVAERRGPVRQGWGALRRTGPASGSS